MCTLERDKSQRFLQTQRDTFQSKTRAQHSIPSQPMLPTNGVGDMQSTTFQHRSQPNFQPTMSLPYRSKRNSRLDLMNRCSTKRSMHPTRAMTEPCSTYRSGFRRTMEVFVLTLKLKVSQILLIRSSMPRVHAGYPTHCEALQHITNVSFQRIQAWKHPLLSASPSPSVQAMMHHQFESVLKSIVSIQHLVSFKHQELAMQHCNQHRVLFVHRASVRSHGCSRAHG